MYVTKIMAWPVIRYICKAKQNYEESLEHARSEKKSSVRGHQNT